HQPLKVIIDKIRELFALFHSTATHRQIHVPDLAQIHIHEQNQQKNVNSKSSVPNDKTMSGKGIQMRNQQTKPHEQAKAQLGLIYHLLFFCQKDLLFLQLLIQILYSET